MPPETVQRNARSAPAASDAEPTTTLPSAETPAAKPYGPPNVPKSCIPHGWASTGDIEAATQPTASANAVDLPFAIALRKFGVSLTPLDVNINAVDATPTSLNVTFKSPDVTLTPLDVTLSSLGVVDPSA